MWKTQLSGLKKSSQCSYLGWFKARKNIPRSFQMNDLLPDPFSHGQTFLMPTARGDQGCCAGNVYLAGPEHFVCFQTGQDREQRTGSTGQRQLSPCAFSRAEQPALSLLLPGRPWLPGTSSGCCAQCRLQCKSRWAQPKWCNCLWAQFVLTWDQALTICLKSPFHIKKPTQVC